jgi:hypothetical protein
MTKALTGLTVKEFFSTEGSGSGYQKGGTWHGNAITFRELMKGKHIGSGAANVTIMDAVTNNLKTESIGAIGMIVGYKVAEKVIKGIGINRQLNKAIRSAGLGNMVKF